MKFTLRIAFFAGVAMTLVSGVGAQWIKQTVETKAGFRGLSVVNENVIWASGTGGTVIRTTDGGKKWAVIQVPDAAKLDFRDIEAFDANTAYILSIGNGESSRIYKTVDGGKTWKLQFTNTDPKAFFDAIACWSESSCIAMSDPVDGKFVLISTSNGGEKWENAFGVSAPSTSDGEAAFAASGTCLIAVPGFRTYLVTGGSNARVLRGVPGFERYKWTAVDAPIVKGTSGSGIFSIAMLDRKNGVIVGGNYEKPVESKDTLAFTSDEGKTWRLGSGLSGYRSGVAYIEKRTIIAVGTNGTDLTLDGGTTWSKAGNEDLNAVAAKGKKAIWAVGPKGLVVKFELKRNK